ncbi:MAG: serine/threonine protein kinase [Candidatus Obscuribacterales bacterium]|nr:serine/threonine protein kinase [Candidatus Obscuribacterales bacterium]
MLKPGTILDHRYELLELIGEGGFGAVWKASEIQLNRLIAIKTLLAPDVKDERSRKRFKREGRALAALSHPHLTRCYRFGLTPEQHFYIAMEFVEGRSLRQILDHEKLSITRILSIASQSCEGLQAAHARGVIHRDLSPNNIMLLNNQADDFVKIIDFGLSRIISADLNGESTVDQRLTSTGAFAGSPHYMSPERYAGKEGDARADVYGLGCILYEMVAGQPVFDGESPIALMRQHTNDIPKPLSNAAPKELVIPPGLEDVLQRALAKNACDRYQTMSHFQDDLQLVWQGKGHLVSKLPSASSQTNRRQLLTKKLAILPAIAIILLAIATGLWLRQSNNRETAQLEESLHDISSTTKRLKTPIELEALTPKNRIEYYSNWLQTYGNTSSQSLSRALAVAQARYRLAIDLQTVEAVESRLQGEQALAEYQTAFKAAVEARKSFEADAGVVGIINCTVLLHKDEDLKTLIPQLIQQIESKGELGLGVALATCRRELSQYYISRNDYKKALQPLDLALSNKQGASIAATEFVNMSVRRARCLRLLGREQEAKAALGDCLRAEAKMAPSSGLAQRTAIVEEAVSQHLPDRDLVPLCFNTINAFRASALPIGNSWSIYQTYADAMISLKKYKEAFDVVADGMPLCPPLAQLQLWQLLCKLNRAGNLNRDQQLSELMLAKIQHMAPCTAQVPECLKAILDEASSLKLDQKNESAGRMLRCIRPAFARYDGGPQAAVYYQLCNAAMQCVQLQQTSEAVSILRTAMAKLSSSKEVKTMRMSSVVAEHMLIIIRQRNDANMSADCINLLAELDRTTLAASINADLADQSAKSLIRCRIYQALHQLDNARTEAVAAIKFAQKAKNNFQEGAGTLELALIAQEQNNEDAESHFKQAFRLFPKERFEWRLRFYTSHNQYYIHKKNITQLRTAMIDSLQDVRVTAPVLYNTLLKSYLSTCNRCGLVELRTELDQQFKPVAVPKT